ncbi:hypothetical protein N015_08405 [Pseudomonas asturiensis]|uniref:Uncharacterized protein n=1 Tax=Pseudomonas asturiensis TaxID=1190415 RepID=A0ABX6HA81_9PSED|nr:hypothetical protein [Pseudomonas asturiensis]QHF02430.1 hypothetical protein N015_08405 [Pseudomonas asturiensis]
MPLKTRQQETARFHAVTEDGELFTIIEITQQAGIDALGSRETEWRNNGREYQTSGADAVNKLSEQEFLIVGLGKKVKRV